MQKYAVLAALLIWAVPVVIFGNYLTNVEYLSRSEQITTASLFGLGSLIGAITISIAVWRWSSTFDFGVPWTASVGIVQAVSTGLSTGGLATKVAIVASILVVTVMSVLVYRLDQRISELEDRPNTGRDISSAIFSATQDIQRQITDINRRVYGP